MQWKSAISNHQATASALASVIETIEIMMAAPPDLLFVFVSPHHAREYALIAKVLDRRFPDAAIVGASGGGVVGGGFELEGTPAISLTAAYLPGGRITAFHLLDEVRPTIEAPQAEWSAALGLEEEPKGIIVMPDPFSFDAQAFARGLDVAFPDCVLLGGLASGGREPGEHALFLGDALHQKGVVGVALSGNIVVDPVVAQGCRPIGAPCFVTRCDGHLLFELDGRPALDVLEEICGELSAADLELAKAALFVGLVMDPERQSYGQGDFLLRNLLGAMPEERALAVGAHLQENRVVQFHVRDARASWADLDSLMAYHAAHCDKPAGALMFSCLGRGTNLYGEVGHDTKVIYSHLGEIPMGGFFCNGELGPVGGQTFLHGYTSALAFFRPAD